MKINVVSDSYFDVPAHRAYQLVHRKYDIYFNCVSTKSKPLISFDMSAHPHVAELKLADRFQSNLVNKRIKRFEVFTAVKVQFEFF
jgi:hypothetical protein